MSIIVPDGQYGGEETKYSNEKELVLRLSFAPFCPGIVQWEVRQR